MTSEAVLLGRHVVAKMKELGPSSTSVARVSRHGAMPSMLNLTGVMHTVHRECPSSSPRPSGGSIVLVSSSAGLKAMTPTVDLANYGYLGHHASKHGVVGLMRAYASAWLATRSGSTRSTLLASQRARLRAPPSRLMPPRIHSFPRP